MKLPRCTAYKYPQGNSNHSIYTLFESLPVCVVSQKCNEGIGIPAVFIHDTSTRKAYFRASLLGDEVQI
jgi:hypothetical protein